MDLVGCCFVFTLMKGSYKLKTMVYMANTAYDLVFFITAMYNNTNVARHGVANMNQNKHESDQTVQSSP